MRLPLFPSSPEVCNKKSFRILNENSAWPSFTAIHPQYIVVNFPDNDQDSIKPIRDFSAINWRSICAYISIKMQDPGRFRFR